jgi:hypothetical protein
MLKIPLEKLAYIIIKAREYDAEVPPVDEQSGSNPSDDADRDVLEESPENPTYQELLDAINGLSELERIELLALTWLGRGDYGKEEWRDALREAMTKRKPITWSERRCSPPTSRKDCPSSDIRSTITRSAACAGSAANSDIGTGREQFGVPLAQESGRSSTF